MAKRKLGGLGRGLDSLFADLPEPDSGSVTSLPLSEIEPDPDQPRKHFDVEALTALSNSIRENGLLQPIAVRPKKAGTGYVIIAGERRWRAAHEAGLDEVPVIVKDVTDEQAAQRIGKSRSAVTNTLRLLTLPDPVREKVRTGAISPGHAKAILGLPTQDLICEAAGQIEAKALNVRQAEALCRKLTRPPKAPKPKEDPFTRPVIATEIEAALKEITGSEVRVEYKDGKGSLRIDFYSESQLKAFAGLLGQYNPEKAAEAEAENAEAAEM